MKIFLQSHDTIQPDSEYKAEVVDLPVHAPVHLVSCGPTPAYAISHVKAGLKQLGFEDADAVPIDDAYGYLEPDGPLRFYAEPIAEDGESSGETSSESSS